MPLTFAVTWDYRCPFARNAHEQVLTALEAGADWDVRFVPFSLGQVHVGEGETDVWDEPAKDTGIVALQAGVFVRDRVPEKFYAVHRDLGRSWSVTLELRDQHALITHGVYRYVRHPMYSGALLFVVAIPLALGSWWGVLLVMPFFPVLVWRILDEEDFLRKNLAGYAEYMQRVRYRLVPSVW